MFCFISNFQRAFANACDKSRAAENLGIKCANGENENGTNAIRNLFAFRIVFKWRFLLRWFVLLVFRQLSDLNQTENYASVLVSMRSHVHVFVYFVDDEKKENIFTTHFRLFFSIWKSIRHSSFTSHNKAANTSREVFVFSSDESFSASSFTAHSIL